MPIEGSLGIEPMCRLAAVSRAGFYRFLEQRHPGEEDMEVRSMIQQIVINIAAATVTGASPSSSIAAAWQSTTSVSCG